MSGGEEATETRQNQGAGFRKLDNSAQNVQCFGLEGDRKVSLFVALLLVNSSFTNYLGN
jgi:hypothetical protein